ncbi:MAG: homoserine dehydrogenase [Armatimonadota bacterium]|nr:homoserine dehydrogenase [Armatimonadota bacterium]
MKPTINIGIIGLGIVGCGALKILQENKNEIALKVGSELRVKRIADLDIERERPVEFDRSILTTDAYEIINDPEIDIVVELIGGVKPAGKFIMDAIKNGKHIVTANKALIAQEGHPLLEEAGNRKQDFFFEASVGGGIPIIRPLKICLAGNKIEQVIGIVNGTTNYILTRMSQDGQDFSDALAEAQRLGYAEADPTNDVEGFDAAYKISILASIAFTSRVDVKGVYHEGITKLTKRDTAYARDLGYCVKLLAIAKRNNGAMEIRVHPAFIPQTHPLASVNDVYNGIFVKGNAVGDVMFYGQGAGAMAAGSAVVGDIIDIARNINCGATGRISCTCFENKAMLSMDDVVTKYYIRMQTADRPKVLASIANIFGDNDVSIASVLQKTRGHNGEAEIVWITHEVKEKNFRTALAAIEKLPVVAQVSNWIRVED